MSRAAQAPQPACHRIPNRAAPGVGFFTRRNVATPLASTDEAVCFPPSNSPIRNTSPSLQPANSTTRFGRPTNARPTVPKPRTAPTRAPVEAPRMGPHADTSAPTTGPETGFANRTSQPATTPLPDAIKPCSSQAFFAAFLRPVFALETGRKTTPESRSFSASFSRAFQGLKTPSFPTSKKVSHPASYPRPIPPPFRRRRRLRFHVELNH